MCSWKWVKLGWSRCTCLEFAARLFYDSPHKASCEELKQVTGWGPFDQLPHLIMTERNYCETNWDSPPCQWKSETIQLNSAAEYETTDHSLGTAGSHSFCITLKPYFLRYSPRVCYVLFVCCVIHAGKGRNAFFLHYITPFEPLDDVIHGPRLVKTFGPVINPLTS